MARRLALGPRLAQHRLARPGRRGALRGLLLGRGFVVGPREASTYPDHADFAAPAMLCGEGSCGEVFDGLVVSTCEGCEGGESCGGGGVPFRCGSYP